MPRWMSAAAILVVWTLVGLVGASQRYLFQISAGRPVPFGEVLAGSITSCWLWALFTPAIVYLARRFRLDRRGWWRTLLLHALFSLGFAALDAVIDAVLLEPIGGGVRHPLASIFFGNAFINHFSYFAVVAVTHAIDYYGLFTERRLAASRLETELLGARLRALEMQLHPHFLFNTLHTIASLVRTNQNSAAVRTIAGLSDLLRTALRRDGAAVVPLREELAFVERYLEIERIRFADRLEIRVVADPEVLEALVPALILQPLVENAIRHGVERRAAPGRVEVSAVRRDGTLVLRVQDSGAGASLRTSSREGAGIGLTNTQARLRHLYGDRHRFELAATPDGGAAAQVEIPFDCEPPSDDPTLAATGAPAHPHR